MDSATILRPSKQIEINLDLLQSFYAEFKKLTDMWAWAEQVDGFDRWLVPPPDQEQQFNDQRGVVAGLAGAAAASHEHRMVGRDGRPFDPILHWTEPFKPRGTVKPGDVISTVEATTSSLLREMEFAEAAERTLAWKFGWFFGWSNRVKAVPGGAVGKAGSIVAIAVQVVGTVLTLFVVWLLARWGLDLSGS